MGLRASVGGRGPGERICDDGLDDDDDGLTDCDDDDCWTVPCHPGGVVSRVHGGRFTQRSSAWRYHASQWGGGASFWAHDLWDSGFSGTARSVLGTVQVLPPGAASWDVTSARTTCVFSVSSVFLSASRSYDASSAHHAEHPALRGGVTVEPGCRVAGSWFLPPVVFPYLGVGYASPDLGAFGNFRSGLAWYQGVVVGGDVTSSYRTWSTSSQGGHGQHGLGWTSSLLRSYEVELGSQGDPWTYPPPDR